MKARYNFRFDNELIKEVDRIAEKEQRSRTNMIEVIIKKYIEDGKKN